MQFDYGFIIFEAIILIVVAKIFYELGKIKMLNDIVHDFPQLAMEALKEVKIEFEKEQEQEEKKLEVKKDDDAGSKRRKRKTKSEDVDTNK